MHPFAARRPSAGFGTLLATELVEIADLGADPSPLDAGGWWVVCAEFEGAVTGYRFARVIDRPVPPARTGRWQGPPAGAWHSSLDADAYRAGVRQIRRYIEAGEVYQVNLCRMLSVPLPGDADPHALGRLLQRGNPAPYAGVLDLGDDWVVCASPELFISRRGSTLVSTPIKGTTASGDAFADKDFDENVMITDLVRNDLGRIAAPGSVVVDPLLERQEHPGISHLVSTVRAELRPGIRWADILAATFPPGSVSGAPKLRALQVISELEPVPRGVYCGAFGYLDADAGTARLAVGIRTFARSGGVLRFGTGAGITWRSDPEAEWQETRLKASRLVTLASGDRTCGDGDLRCAP